MRAADGPLALATRLRKDLPDPMDSLIVVNKQDEYLGVLPIAALGVVGTICEILVIVAAIAGLRLTA